MQEGRGPHLNGPKEAVCQLRLPHLTSCVILRNSLNLSELGLPYHMRMIKVPTPLLP